MVLDSMSRWPRYDLLPTTTAAADGEDSDPTGSSTDTEKASRSERAKILSMVAVIVAALVFVSLGLRFIIAESARKTVSLSSSSSSSPPSSQSQSCGATREQALSQGCAFDVVSFAWMAPACYDRELSAEFSSLRAWGWFLDENRTQAVPQSEVEQGEFDALYVSNEQLAYHCVYMWRKMHRAILRKNPLDSVVGGYNHTKYCGRVLLEGRKQDSGTAILMVSRFASCGI